MPSTMEGFSLPLAANESSEPLVDCRSRRELAGNGSRPGRVWDELAAFLQLRLKRRGGTDSAFESSCWGGGFTWRPT